jgi:hypothetical protein
MEICGALCDGVVIFVVAQQEEVDIRAVHGLNLGDCCHGFSRRASPHADAEFPLVPVLWLPQLIGKD